MSIDLDDAYRHCWRIATTHYENFTVGSWMLPRRLRRHIAAIYAFARTADDIADEGEESAEERLRHLAAWEEALEDCYRGRYLNPIFRALGDTAARFDLPAECFRDLLDAFRRDVEFKPFPTYDDLLSYCRCSADPVGRLILHLFGYRDEERQGLSDAVCTGLQLTNFWQDVAIDAAKGRVYLPLEDLERFGCAAEDLLGAATGGEAPPRPAARSVVPEASAAKFNGEDEVDGAWRQLMVFEVERARALLLEGRRLCDLVDRRLSREVFLFAGGGLAILRKIESVDFDVFRRRPALSRWEKIALVLRAGTGLPPTETLP